MKTYNNFNEMFNANSNTNKSLSVFNALLPEVKNDVADTLRRMVNQYAMTDELLPDKDYEYLLELQIDGGCPDMIEVIKNWCNNTSDCEELLNDLGVDVKKEFYGSEWCNEYIDDCLNNFSYDGWYGDTEEGFIKAQDEYIEECLEDIPENFVKALAKNELISYVFDTHAKEIKDMAFGLIKKEGPNEM